MTSLFIASALFVAAQDQDPKAKAILDEVSKTTKSYKTISADYSFAIFNKDKKQLEKWLGKVAIKGQKFRLEIPGNTIVCDGTTLWNFNKDAKEVTIKTFDSENEEDYEKLEISLKGLKNFLRKKPFLKNKKEKISNSFKDF